MIKRKLGLLLVAVALLFGATAPTALAAPPAPTPAPAPPTTQASPTSFGNKTLSGGQRLYFENVGPIPDITLRLEVVYLPTLGRNRVVSYGENIFGDWVPVSQVDLTYGSCSQYETTTMPTVCWLAKGVVQIYSTDLNKNYLWTEYLVFLPTISSG
jgi:hypothetical protein